MAASRKVSTKLSAVMVDQPETVRAAVAGGTTVREVVDQAGFLDDADEFTAVEAAETRAVLDRLTDDHNQLILDTLTQAVDAGVPVDVTWDEVDQAHLDVSVSSDAAGMHIVVRGRS